MTRARNIAGFSTITTTPSPVHVGPIGVLTATRIDGEFNVVDITSRDLTAQGIGVTNLQVSGITTGLNVSGVATFANGVDIQGSTSLSGDLTNLNVSGIITAQNGINFNGTSTGLNASGISTIATLDVNGNADVSGNLTVGGVLTYEDVTNVDSVGVVTARGLNIFGNTTGLQVASGISTFQAITGTTGTFSGDITANGNITGDDSTNITGINQVTIGDLYISENIVHRGDDNTRIRFPANDNISFQTIGVEALRIDSAQRLIHGATASNNVGGFGGAAIQIEGTSASTSAFSLIRHGNNTVGSTILMGKTRGTSDAAVTIVQDDDNVARIIAYGADGTDTESSLGAIQFDVDGTPGANDMPGRIVFSTTPDGAATYTERLRITSAGKVGINQAAPDGMLHVFSASAGTVTADADADELTLENSGNVGLSLLTAATGESSVYFGNPGTNGQKDGWIKYYHESHSTTANRRALSFKSGGGSEKMRIDAFGRVLIGGTSAIIASSSEFAEIVLTGKTRGAGITLQDVDANTRFQIRTDDAGGDPQTLLNASTNHPIVIRTNNTERVRITSAGEVQINDAAAGQTVLSCEGLYANSGNVDIATFGRQGNAVKSAIRYADASTSMMVGSTTSHHFGIMTGGTERVRVISTGNVGINRTDPDQRLNVSGNIETNAYDSTSGSGGYYTAKGLIIGNLYDAGKSYTGSDDRTAIVWQERGLDLDFATSDALRLKIHYGGEVSVTGGVLGLGLPSNNLGMVTKVIGPGFLGPGSNVTLAMGVAYAGGRVIAHAYKTSDSTKQTTYYADFQARGTGNGYRANERTVTQNSGVNYSVSDATKGFKITNNESFTITYSMMIEIVGNVPY